MEALNTNFMFAFRLIEVENNILIDMYLKDFLPHRISFNERINRFDRLFIQHTYTASLSYALVECDR